MRVYVENKRAVQTALFSFNDEVRARLRSVLKNVAERIAIRARTAMAGHARSGDLAGSVRTSVKEYGDNRWGPFAYNRISASVVAGGTRRVSYAHAFERGFDDRVQVDAHTRGSASNPRIVAKVYRLKGGAAARTTIGGSDVKSYQRRHVVKAHLYLNAALDAEAPGAITAVSNAIGAVARLKGFA